MGGVRNFKNPLYKLCQIILLTPLQPIKKVVVDIFIFLANEIIIMKFVHLVFAKMGRKKKINAENSVDKPKDIFTIEANMEQIQFLARILPKGCSFQKLEMKKSTKNKGLMQQLKKLVTPDQLETCEQLPKTRKGTVKKDKKMTEHQNQSQSFEQNSSESQFLDYKFCLNIIEQLKKHSSSWPFRQPVDAEQLGVPEYFQIIKEPMDLLTIQNKLKQGRYLHNSQFELDVRKIIENSYKFNEGNYEYIKPTKTFENCFERLLRKAQKQKMCGRYSSLSESESQTKCLTLMEKSILMKQIKSLSRQQRQVVMKIAYGDLYRQTILDINNLQIKKQRDLQKFVAKMSSVEAQIEQQESQRADQSSFRTESSSEQADQ